MKNQNGQLGIQSKSELNEKKTNNSNSSKGVEYEHVKQTPFTLIKRDNVKYWEITIGNDIASSKKFKKKREAKKYIRKQGWLLNTTTIMIICDKIINNKLKNNTKE